jgi:hypothetical protein
MQNFQPLAQPWWVNILVFIPPALYFLWRKKNLQLAWRQIFTITVFALAFGFVEAAVVAYLRAAIGLLPGYHGTLADVQRLSLSYQQAQSIGQFPESLLTIELFREAATVIMLVCVAFLAASRSRERWAAFLWAFAIWDIAYYGGLWAIVRWPQSFKELDVLFLIPVPWLAQVWYPLLVSALTLLALAATKMRRSRGLDTPSPPREQSISASQRI